MPNSRNYRARLSAICLILLLLAQTGCGPKVVPPPSTDVLNTIKQIAILPIDETPESNFHTFAVGKEEGAKKGAERGAAEGAASSLSGGAAFLFVLPLTMSLGGAFGSIEGRKLAVPKDKAEYIQSAIKNAFATENFSLHVAKAVMKTPLPQKRVLTLVQPGKADISTATNRYHSFQENGFDTIMEIKVSDVGFQSDWGGDTPSLQLYMNAQVRLKQASDNKELYTRNFGYLSYYWKPIEHWVADNGKLFTEEFERATQNLGERIATEILIVPYFPFDDPSQAYTGVVDKKYCWFKPVDPERTIVRITWPWEERSEDHIPTGYMKYTLVDSTQPILKWQSFPREDHYKFKKNQQIINNISDVSYDLKILEARGGGIKHVWGFKLVYDREGLPEPMHKLEYTLKPDTKYYWSFRAKYKFNGETKITRWAFSAIPLVWKLLWDGSRVAGPVSCEADEIPSQNYYRFKTP